jgi:NRAMP (natural resistance-associated macrophage protein)-like metal ion transporter
MLLQHLCVKLGVVTGRDLAQACRDAYPRPAAWGLWLLCELAIAACDLAEVVGSAIDCALLASLVWAASSPRSMLIVLSCRIVAFDMWRHSSLLSF